MRYSLAALLVLLGAEMSKKTLVRCEDNRVFEIDPKTTEALACSYYDPYCRSCPGEDVIYMEYSEWLKLCDRRWAKYFQGRVI